MALVFRNSQATNGQSTTIQFDQAVAHTWAVLAGFQASYGSDHHVKTIKVAADTGHDNSPSAVQVDAEVTIEDDSGHSDGGTLYVMGIGQTADDGCQFKSHTWKPGQGQVVLTWENQPAPLDYAWVFIQGFELSYGRKDHEVKTITVDAGNATLVTSSAEGRLGYTWTITFTPDLAMHDDSGNAQSGQSSLDLLIMAVPASAESDVTPR
jgi:hypothetical protein